MPGHVAGKKILEDPAMWGVGHCSESRVKLKLFNGKTQLKQWDSWLTYVVGRIWKLGSGQLKVLQDVFTRITLHICTTYSPGLGGLKLKNQDTKDPQ